MTTHSLFFFSSSCLPHCHLSLCLQCRVAEVSFVCVCVCPLNNAAVSPLALLGVMTSCSLAANRPVEIKKKSTSQCLHVASTFESQALSLSCTTRNPSVKSSSRRSLEGKIELLCLLLLLRQTKLHPNDPPAREVRSARPAQTSDGRQAPPTEGAWLPGRLTVPTQEFKAGSSGLTA